MAGKVIHDHDVSDAQFGNEDLGHIGLEGVAVDRAIQDKGCDDAAQRESADEGRGFPMAVWNADPQALAPEAAPVAAGHVGFRPGLVDEHQALGIEIELPLEPGLAPAQDVRTGLLARMSGLFLRVILWRLKKR